ncbi:MAG: HigA family addiction module antitoxin [Gemmatimonadota bacterium]
MMVRVPTVAAPTHPGEMLRTEFLEPLGMTQSDLATRVGISFPRVNEIVNGKRPVTMDTALRFARLFRTSPDFWLTLQLRWDLYRAQHDAVGKSIAKIRPLEVVEARQSGEPVLHVREEELVYGRAASQSSGKPAARRTAARTQRRRE